MAGMKQRVTRAAVAAGAVTTLVGTGISLAPVAQAARPGTVLKVAFTSNGMYVDGPTTFPAGRVTVFVDAAVPKGQRGVEIAQLATGYTWHDWRTDVKTVGENLFGPNGNKKKGLKALNHAIANLTGFGGLYAFSGQVRHGTVLLTQPGTYVLYNDSGDVPQHPVHLTVTAPSGPQTLAATDATVIAKTNRRFGGDDVLPAHGNITFENHSTESPHFLVLQHVKEGTTRKQVIDSFSSNQRPSFGLPGEQDLDVLTTGQAMNAHLSLPPGEYAQMCFFPDPKTGMPHAFMGMVRMVHLK